MNDPVTKLTILKYILMFIYTLVEICLIALGVKYFKKYKSIKTNDNSKFAEAKKYKTLLILVVIICICLFIVFQIGNHIIYRNIFELISALKL